MRLRGTIVFLVAALVVAFPAGASAHGEKKSQGQPPARDYALQALAVLDQGGSPMQASELLDLAVKAKDKSDIDMGSVSAARATLAAGQTDSARADLEKAFPPDDSHVIGSSITPKSRNARIAAAGVGLLALAIAAVGLFRRGRGDRVVTT